MSNWPRKQILTPGLVQMVSVLALNKLELSEMIVPAVDGKSRLGRGTDTVPLSEDLVKAAGTGNRTRRQGCHCCRLRKTPEMLPIPSVILIMALFSKTIWIQATGHKCPSEQIEKPSFENFLSKPVTLYDHLHWQLNLSMAPENVSEAAYSIIGNLNEDGYLTATLEEISNLRANWSAGCGGGLELVQSFDPAGVAAPGPGRMPADPVATPGGRTIRWRRKLSRNT